MGVEGIGLAVAANPEAEAEAAGPEVAAIGAANPEAAAIGAASPEAAAIGMASLEVAASLEAIITAIAATSPPAFMCGRIITTTIMAMIIAMNLATVSAVIITDRAIAGIIGGGIATNRTGC